MGAVRTFLILTYLCCIRNTGPVTGNPFVATSDKLSTNTSQELVASSPSPLGSNASDDNTNTDRCYILDEIGTWDFFYRYTHAEIGVVMCDCWLICIDEETIANFTNRSSEFEFEEVDDYFSFVLLTTIYTVIFTFGLVGNFLTITTVVVWMKSRSPTFLLIVGLACSDVLVILVCLPLKEVEFFRISIIFVGFSCKLVYYIKDFSLACSVLTLSVISFERFYAICYPLKAKFRCSTTRARVLILLVWILSGVLAIPTLIAVKSYRSTWSDTNLCTRNFMDPLHTQLYFVYYLVILYILPLFVMMYTYGRSCMTLWRSAQAVQKMQGDATSAAPESTGRGTDEAHKHPSSSYSVDNNTKKTVQQRKQVLRLLLTMLAAFAICWGPTLIIHVLIIFNVTVPYFYKTRLAVDTLAFFNSCLNPYLLLFMSSQFREVIGKKLLCKARKKQTPNRKLATRSKYKESSTNISTVSSNMTNSTETITDKP